MRETKKIERNPSYLLSILAYSSARICGPYFLDHPIFHLPTLNFSRLRATVKVRAHIVRKLVFTAVKEGNTMLYLLNHKVLGDL